MEGLSFEVRGTSVVDAPHPRQQQHHQHQQYQQLQQQQGSIGLPEQATGSSDALGQLMSSVIAQNAGSVLSALGQNLVTSVIGQGSAATHSYQQHQQQQQQQEPSHMLPPPRMTQSQDSQQLGSSIEVDEDFELISDEEFQ